MKFYLSLLASLCLASTPFITPVIALESKIVAQASAINPYIKENIAPKITVRIDSAENGGSGVIIAKQDNTYLILTNAHVLREDNSFTVYTHDGETHQAQEIANSIETEDDLALLEFTSNNAYEIADINSAAKPQVEQSVLVVGYSTETGELVTQEEVIKKVPNKTLKDGYQIGYSGDVVQGMSGGAILNTDGEVIGINGKSAFPILDTGYVYQDGSKISTEEVEQLRQLSWGLSINRLLTQVNQETITAYNLPLPETSGEFKTSYTGWIGDLEAKAKQITVRIDSTSGGNGSGVIIAKEGNIYTVLTAAHVLCEKDEKTRECIEYDYIIITPDSKSQTIDPQKIQAQPGVDLAVFQFVSNENYEVAELADYPLQNDDAIFVAGYPQLVNNPQWQFSLGYGLEKEQGLLRVNINSNNQSSDGSNLATSQSNPVSAYEMVYTSITYGGMSGGAVLDREGRVIGVHGLAEGETAINSQDGSSQKKKIQLGYSLGVPIRTFIGLKEQFEVESALSIQSKQPQALNTNEQNVLTTAILGTEISDGNATPKQWLERGNNLWRLGRYKEAERAFDRAINLKPEFIHLAYYGKGLSLLYQKKYKTALASLEQATSIQFSFASAFETKSSVLQALNRWNKALTAIKNAIELQPDNANWYSKKGNILLRIERYSEAKIAFTKAIELDSRNAFYLNRGLVYDELGEKELALADYNQALKINSQSTNVYLNRGLVYDELGEKELALADYNQALKINSQDADVYYNRGILYRSLGKSKLSLSDFNKAIKINPQYANAYINRGNLHVELGEKELALADYNEAIKINPRSANVYVNRGSVYRDRGKLDLAEADYSQAISINPKNAGAYFNRGNLYKKRGEKELALADLQKAQQLFLTQNNSTDAKIIAVIQGLTIELTNSNSEPARENNPQSAEEYYNRGLAYQKQNKVDLAIADYTQALQFYPQSAEAYFYRGLLYYEKGEKELALADYSEAIKINPNLDKVYYSRAFIYDQKGEKELALADWSEAIKINSKFDEAYNNRGIVYAEKGEKELALADWNKAIEINNQYSDAFTNRGLLYVRKGEKELGIANLQKAQQLFIEQNDSARAEQVANVLQKLTIQSTNSNSEVAGENKPQSTEEYYNRGLAYHKQNEDELAIADYTKAIELNPSNEKALINRGLLYAKQDKDDLALADYSQAISINPNYSGSYRNRGVLYFKQDKYKLAEADCNKAIEVNPEDAQAYFNRGLLFQKLGDETSAQADLEKARQLAIAQDNDTLAQKIVSILER